MTVQSYAGGRAPRPSSLADVLELILDKGLVIDAYVRVSLVGIELLTIDARIVVASVDTYLRFAEATNRLDLQAVSESEGLPQMIEDVTEGGASHKTKGALSGAKDEVSSWFGGGDDDDKAREKSRDSGRSNGRGRDRDDGDDNGSRRQRVPARAGARRGSSNGERPRRRRSADEDDS